MEATVIFLVLIIGLAALGLASVSLGVDSREQYKDDHAR